MRAITWIPTWEDLEGFPKSLLLWVLDKVLEGLKISDLSSPRSILFSISSINSLFFCRHSLWRDVELQRQINTFESLQSVYCKTHYYRAPFNFTHFALSDDDAYITGADIRSNCITMPHIAVIQLMRVIKWLQSDSDGSSVNTNVCGNKGFYSTIISWKFRSAYEFWPLYLFCKIMNGRSWRPSIYRQLPFHKMRT